MARAGYNSSTSTIQKQAFASIRKLPKHNGKLSSQNSALVSRFLRGCRGGVSESIMRDAGLRIISGGY